MITMADTEQDLNGAHDPAFLACFDTAMLDYEILNKNVEDKGMQLKHAKDMERLKKQGKWNAAWLVDNYAAVCSKVSNLSRRMRDFIEYLGDNASIIWMQTEATIMERAKAAEPSKAVEKPKE